MDSISLLSTLYFAGIVLVINLAPGPAMLFVMQSSLKGGIQHGLYAAVGVESGVFCYVVLSALGLGFILKEYPMVYQTVQIIGIVYLLYLAYSAWPRHDKSSSQTSITHIQDSKAYYHSAFLKGLLINLTNPKIGLFFVTLMPQFIPHGSSQVRFLIYGLCFNVCGIIVNGTVALFAQKAKQMISRIEWFDYVPPILFITISMISIKSMF